MGIRCPTTSRGPRLHRGLAKSPDALCLSHPLRWPLRRDSDLVGAGAETYAQSPGTRVPSLPGLLGGVDSLISAVGRRHDEEPAAHGAFHEGDGSDISLDVRKQRCRR